MTDTHTRRHLRVLQEMADDFQSRATGFENSVERRHLAKRMHEKHGALLWALRALRLASPLTGSVVAPQNVVDAVITPMLAKANSEAAE